MPHTTQPACRSARACTALLVCLLAGAPSPVPGQAIGAPATQPIASGHRALQPRDSVELRSLVPLDPRIDEQRQSLFSSWPRSVAPTDSGPGVWKYVGWGALIGGVLAGGYTAYRTRDCNDCMFVGIAIGGATGIGAVVGGLIGSFIYADRYWSDDR